MNALLELSLRGSLIAGLVWLLDKILAGRIAAAGRRGWWVLVPLAFLVAIPMPVLSGTLVPAHTTAPGLLAAARFFPVPDASHEGSALESALGGVWLAGALGYLLTVVIQTRSALRRWSRLRLSTDPAWLDLLEDAKAQLGITAPIGLVVSEEITAPVIMGWLRPRILLPQAVTAALSRGQLRAVLLHELAHFRALDVPLAWLFTVARTVHWFNPAIHLAAGAWARFREEAADETALAALVGQPVSSYSEALLAVLRAADRPAVPFGALAIGESVHQLKRRLLMINRHPTRSFHPVPAYGALALLACLALLHPVRADAGDAKAAAVAAMQAWLAEIDAAHYDQSWTEAAPDFQKAVTSPQWVSALTSVRTPLGKNLGRKLDSALEQTAVPSPTGTQHGDFVIAQFDSSYENLKYAVETVTFEKAPDGSWKASGYYIKPKM